MAKRLKHVDVVTIGVGLTGSMLALELARAGLKVVGIERGAPRFTVPDFQSPAIHDELRFSIRKAMKQDNVKEAGTFRNASDQTALPIRRWESFLPGTGLGGSFVHWNGQSFRFQAADFIYKSHIEQRYGKKILDPDLTIQDWGVTYDELEPHFDRFEYLCGVSGKAGNIKGAIQPGGNPFDAPRARDYALPPLTPILASEMLTQAAQNNVDDPIPLPSASTTRPYTNTKGSKYCDIQYSSYCQRYA